MKPGRAMALAACGLALVVATRWSQSAPTRTASQQPGFGNPEAGDDDPARAVAKASGEGDAVTVEDEAGGRHWRVRGSHGPIHAWAPPGFRPATAGIVIYAHGYYTDVDRAWREHQLAAQFLRSGVNALFIAPEVPARTGHRLRWESLGELIREVRMRLSLPRPWGPVVAIGHSGAYRTLVTWLEYAPLAHVIVLDGLYGHEDEFRQWLGRKRGDGHNRLTMVSIDTLRWSERFVRELGEDGASGEGDERIYAMDWVPERAVDLPAAARRATVLYMRSQFGHMEIVTEGEVIPLLLSLTALSPLGEPGADDAGAPRPADAD